MSDHERKYAKIQISIAVATLVLTPLFSSIVVNYQLSKNHDYWEEQRLFERSEQYLDKKLNLFADQLKPMARVSSISLSGDVPRGALQTVVDGVTYAIPLDGLLDKTVERDRLNKEISKIEVEISKIDNKLSNHAFVSNAPEKVVVLQKDRKLSYLNELEKLNLALVNLN